MRGTPHHIGPRSTSRTNCGRTTCARSGKGANDAKLGKGKGRSGGRAAPKKDRKAKEKEKGKEAEPCICGNCMWQETYDLYIKDKEKA